MAASGSGRGAKHPFVTAHRTEVPGPAQPVFGIGERLQDTDRDHACLEQALEECRAVISVAGAEPFDDGFAIHDLDVLVVREGAVGAGGRCGKAVLQGSDEGGGIGRHAGLLGVAGDLALVLLPGDELVAVVAVLFAARDAQVARLQLVDHLGEQADLEVAPVHLGRRRFMRRAPGQQRPPLLAHPGQVERSMDGGAIGCKCFDRGPQLGLPVSAVRQQEAIACSVARSCDVETGAAWARNRRKAARWPP